VVWESVIGLDRSVRRARFSRLDQPVRQRRLSPSHHGDRSCLRVRL